MSQRIAGSWVGRQWTLGLVALGMLIGCGGGEKTKERPDLVAAFDAKDPRDQAKKAEANMKKLKERAAAKAKAEAEAKWAKILVLPADAPGDIKGACAMMKDGYDKFHSARVTGPDKPRWEAVKEADLKNAEEKCVEAGNLELALCEANAFHNAPADFTSDDTKSVFMRCEDKFAQNTAAAAK